MHIVALKTLRTFWKIHLDAETPLRAWYAIAKRAQWRTPADIKADYRHASFVGANRVVFNIKGNHFRLIAAFDFERQIAFVKWFGWHKDYNKIDPSEVQHEYPPC